MTGIFPEVEALRFTYPILLSKDIAQLLVTFICPPWELSLVISLAEIIPFAAALITTVLTTPLVILRELTYSCTAASSSSPRSNGLPLCFVSRQSTVTLSPDLLFDASLSFSKYSVFSLLVVDSFILTLHFEEKCFAALVAPFYAAYFPISALWTAV